jgi:hypothetical protein
MALQVLENNSVKHDGVVYKAGETIQNIDEDAKAELVRSGVAKDLDVAETENQPAAPAAPPAPTDELERGQVEDQMAANVAQDLADAEKLANTPGDPVVNNQAKPGLVDKIRSAVTGEPAAPAAPSAEEIAADPQLK